MKHTPGPWKVREPDHFVDGLAHMVVSEHPQEGYWHIAEIGTHNGRKESEANARLIAAAPEMLEALKEAQVCIFMAEGSSEIYCKIGKIIDKTEGR